MDPVNFVAVLVSIIAAAGSWAVARSSSRAQERTAELNTRVEMEKEAYDRARLLDTGTIERQKAQLQEVREENASLKEQIKRLEARISVLEKEVRDEDY